MIKTSIYFGLALLSLIVLSNSGGGKEVKKAVKDKPIVVLTVNDSVASHATFVAPLLQKYGFGATFSMSCSR